MKLFGTVALCFLLTPLWFTASLAPLRAEDSQYFPQTGHSISGKFLEYWNTHGGLPVFGYPITEAAPEVDPETGHTFNTQWFERTRFELHPENAGTKYEVLLGLLGKDLRREALGLSPEFAPTVPYIGPELPQHFFSETHHNVAGKFLSYWQSNGGLERFGYPISEPHQEIDPSTGQAFLSQWFERARFELHPDNKSPYDVLLGLLGNQIKKPDAFPPQFDWKIEPSFDLFKYQAITVDSKGNLYAAAYDTYVAYHIYKSDYAENSLRIVKIDSTGQLTWKMGSQGKEAGQFGRVVAIATDQDDNIYLADSSNHRIEKFNSNGQFLLQWGSQGEADGQFKEITGLAVDTQNNVFVLDAGLSRVQKFDADGHFLLQWGSQGKGDGQFQSPFAITTDPSGSIYVSDNLNLRVEKFDTNGHFLLQWGDGDNGGYKFGYVPGFDHNPAHGGPTSLVADKTGNIYVSDWGNYQIVKFDTSGHVLAKWTTEGKFGLNLYPKMAVDPSNNIYLAAEAQLERYNTDQKLLNSWTYQYQGLEDSDFTPVKVDSQGNVYIGQKVGQTAYLRKLNPTGQTLANLPLGLDTDGKPCFVRGLAIRGTTNNIYILCSNSVKVIDQSGQLLKTWGSAGTNDGQLDEGRSIAVDRLGQVYVSDRTKRIQKFGADGHFLTKWEVKQVYNAFLAIWDLAVDSLGQVYVALYANDSLAVYSPNGQFIKYIHSSQSMSEPHSLTFNSQDDLYVLGGRDNSISKVKAGVVEWRYATPSVIADGSWEISNSIAADDKGNIFVISGTSHHHNLQKLHSGAS